MGGHLNINHLMFLGQGALWTIGLSVIAQRHHRFPQFRVIGGDAAGFAQGAEIFSGVKTESRRDAE